MRIWLFWGYLVFLFIATCTESLSLFLSQQIVTFHFNVDPPVNEFFHNDLNFQDRTYVNQKLGHVISFFFLALLIHYVWRRGFVILLITLAVALLTEVAQLFFSRSGRLLDVGFDMGGALLLVLFLSFYRFIDYFIFKKNHVSPLNRR